MVIQVQSSVVSRDLFKPLQAHILRSSLVQFPASVNLISASCALQFLNVSFTVVSTQIQDDDHALFSPVLPFT